MTKITVQSVHRFPGTDRIVVEWAETVGSWKAAWKLVDNCGADRKDCTKMEIESGRWVLTIH